MDSTDWKQGRAKKLVDFICTDRLEVEIEASPFQYVEYPSLPGFYELPSDKWVNDD